MARLTTPLRGAYLWGLASGAGFGLAEGFMYAGDFYNGMAWYDWPVRSIAVVAVPMVLHGLYDTLLKKEMNALALGVAVFSFLYLALQVDGKYADAALGRFSTAGDEAQFVAVLEGKGPHDPLDRPFAGRRLSAVDQALRYAVNLPCDWYLVTNLRETRLYRKGHDQFTCERFETAALAADEATLRKFVFLLGAARVLPAPGSCHLDLLLADSERIRSSAGGVPGLLARSYESAKGLLRLRRMPLRSSARG